MNLHTFIPAIQLMRRLAAGCAFISSLSCGVAGTLIQANVSHQAATEPIAVGQKLTIQLSSWAIGGMVKIKGNGQDLPLIFEFAEQNGEKVVRRFSNIGDTPTLPQFHGGWPFGAQPRGAKLTLAATRTAWQVSVDDQRMPWLDYKHPEGETYTGYEVTALPVTGTPTVEAIVCGINCGMDECRCGGSPDQCRHKRVGASPSSSCTMAGPDNECCIGSKPVLDLDEIQEGDIVKVVDVNAQDPGYIDRACLAAGAFGLCPEIKNAQAAGTKLVVMSRGREKETNIPNGKVTVYFPAPAHAELTASSWMFVKQEGIERVAQLTGPPGVVVDQGTGQIKWLNYDLNNGNGQLRSGDFFSRLVQDGVTWQYTPARLRQFAGTGRPYSVIVSDAPRLIPESPERCQSRVGWIDSATTPMGCARYGGQDGGEAWCTKFGLPTRAWKSERGGVSFDTFKNNGESALEACCACGGGTPS